MEKKGIDKMKKVKALLYCTKKTPYLVKDDYTFKNKTIYYTHYKEPGSWGLTFNGKIVAECDIETDEIDYYFRYGPSVNIGAGFSPDFEEESYVRRRFGNYKDDNKLFEESCLSYDQLDEYLKQKDGYALHISNLFIFENPVELSDYNVDNSVEYGSFGWAFEDNERITPLKKAPQNMMRVYDANGNKYILISVQSEWLCKILNGEKTIEVRRKVLKEML